MHENIRSITQTSQMEIRSHGLINQTKIQRKFLTIKIIITVIVGTGYE